MIGIKFSQTVVPFPPGNGVYVRLTFKENEDKSPGAPQLNVVQGHVLIFNGAEIVDLANGNITTPEVLLEGDNRTRADGMLCTYTRVEGARILKKMSDEPPASPLVI